MFTGLVQELGRVRSVEPAGDGLRLEVEAPAIAAEVAPGDSVSVSGCCLTATEVAPDGFRCDVMAETLARTALGGLAAGDPVNLELALRLGDRLGGHFVQGHVDATGEVTAVDEEGFARRVRIAAPAGLLRYVVEKGSIALDGISLTVTDVDEEGFGVAIIPHTLAVTTLGARQPGDRVNVEVDIVAKYVERLVAPHERS